MALTTDSEHASRSKRGVELYLLLHLSAFMAGYRVNFTFYLLLFCILYQNGYGYMAKHYVTRMLILLGPVKFCSLFIHSTGMCRMRQIPCRSQGLLPFPSVMYFFLPPIPTYYSSILSHFILPSISWSTSQSCCSQIHI